MDREKILDALKVIKDTCMVHTCDGCPLRDNEHGCHLVAESPDNWEIREKNEIWRAFNE